MTSRRDDAQQQLVEVTRAMMRLSWAMTVLGAQQAANLMRPSTLSKSGERFAEACDAVASAIEEQLGGGLKDAYKAGEVFATAPVDGLPGAEIHRSMQRLAMQPVFFESLKLMMPAMVASMSALMPGRDAALARQECQAKMDVMQLVQDVRDICPDRDSPVPLGDSVERAYALGTFPALWAVEGLGHDLVEARRHRGESLANLLTAPEVGELPDGSLTMLHAGIGMGLAEVALEDLRPDSPTATIDAGLRRFVEDCRASSRAGYEGCALESLGLVCRHLYGHSMVSALDERLGALDEAVRGFFWHGVGRAVYFSPENMVPRLDSPWPAVAMVDRQAPHDLARENMVSGVAWAMTMVNLRRPAVLEGFLKRHGAGFGETDAFVNGVMSSMIMRMDTTPDEPSIASLLAHEPSTGDSRVVATWDRVVRQPLTKALNEYHPALKRRQRLGEVFRFTLLSALC